MKIDAETSLKDLAFIVSTALQKAGFSAVLCGGAVVSIYTDNRYESGDLDFVTPHRNIDLAIVMTELGFTAKGKAFVHPECTYYVEFQPSPVMLGGQPSTGAEVLTSKSRTLRLLSPTESVMDRLIAYFAWRDPQSKDQAVMICQSQTIDMKRIKKWAIAEGYAAEFEIFRSELASSEES